MQAKGLAKGIGSAMGRIGTGAKHTYNIPGVGRVGSDGVTPVIKDVSAVAKKAGDVIARRMLNKMKK